MAETLTIDELLGRIGQEVGVSKWFDIPQSAIDAFADLTHDHQFIHIDVEKAKATPFGGTIAHGFLTLSLIPLLTMESDCPRAEGIKMGVNYGCGKVRFPSPVPVGSNLRLGATLDSVEDLPGGRAQISMTFTCEVEGAPTPACVSEINFRYSE